MADNFKFAQLQDFSLSGAGAITGATTITLQSMTDIDGNALSMSGTFGAKGFGTMEPGNGALEEQISFTGLTNNANGTVTLSGVSSVTFTSTYTETSGLAKTHAGSTTFVISNTSGFYNEMLSKNDDETIAGTYTFTNPNYPRMDTDTPFPTDNEQLATKAYADSLTFAGAPNATTTQKGIVELATQTEVDAKTATGGTGASLVATPALARSTLLSDYKLDTGAADAYVITPSPLIGAYTTGQIFTFKAANTNTGASTLAVNGFAATPIKKLDGATALIAGDIVAGQIVEVEFDGTNFQMTSPPANTTAIALPGFMQMYGGTAAPTGWLLCDGTSYLRATYPSLFAILSTTYGSADGTHFNVPDLRGRIPIGVGTGTGGGASGTGLPAGGSALTAVALATWKGEQTHLLSAAESGLPAHTHTASVFAVGAGGAAFAGANGGSQGSATTDANVAAAAASAHNNIQPVMGVNFIIKT